MTKPAVTALSEAWHPPPGAELSGPYLTGRGKTRADDAALIELSGTQPEAFAAIFDRHATEIHRFAARRLGEGAAEARAYRVLARTGTDPVAVWTDDEVLARVAASEHRRALAAGLARLHVADRDTLLLVVWGGLSYAETAHALSVPVGTVRSRLNRARRKLRTALGDTSPLEPEEESQS